MVIRFAPSASKHEIARDDIRYVIRHCGLAFDAPPPPGSPYTEDRILILGDTPTGVAIEILAIELDSGDLYVFHARKMGKQYQQQHEEALKCRV